MEENGNRYYTPEIEEFHVGFEYKLKGEDSIRVLSTNCTVDTELSEVKYLDKEDIESLGWEYNGGKMIEGYQDRFHIIEENKQFNLVYTFNINQIRIDVECLNMFEESMNYLFVGIIKNKSELIKILKQIGITE
jgi:hypothetical protein